MEKINKFIAKKNQPKKNEETVLNALSDALDDNRGIAKKAKILFDEFVSKWVLSSEIETDYEPNELLDLYKDWCDDLEYHAEDNDTYYSCWYTLKDYITHEHAEKYDAEHIAKLIDIYVNEKFGIKAK